MRVRNITGVQQTLGRVTLPPHEWLDVPKTLAWELAKRRMAEVQVEDKDVESDRILWMGPLSIGDGYGTANETLIWALKGVGVDVYPTACWFKEKEIAPETNELLKEPYPGMMRIGVCMATPGEFPRIPTPYRIGLTMYESDDPLKAHPEWRHECRAVDRLIVPSKYCRDVFGQFFDGPIDVRELAVNPLYYTARKRVPKDTFTFAMHGTLSSRKGPLETIEAWKKAFPKGEYPHVRLEIKTRLGILGWDHGRLPDLDDDRIIVHSDTWSRERMRDWLHEADCYLFLSKGEGYGLPPREALCTGLPVIVSNHTGLESMCHRKYTWPIKTHHLEDSPLGGNWRIPDWDQAIDKMRWMVEHREEAYERAYQGANWFIDKYGADVVALSYKQLLEGIDPVSDRGHLPPSERYGLTTGITHAEFYQAVKDIPGPIYDYGVGDGSLYITLSKLGKDVIGIVSPEDYAEAKRAIEAAGIKPRLIVRNLFDPDHLEKRTACVSQGVLQQYTHDEVRRLVWIQRRLGEDVYFSVPTVHYPDHFREGAYLRRLPEWRDIILSDYQARTRYYCKRKYIMGHIFGERGHPVPQNGRIIDGLWFPNQMEEE